MRFWAGTLLASVAWLLVVPDSALAGCSSHPIPIIAYSMGPGINLETIDHAGDLAVADVTAIPRPPKPCTGEMCSGRPAMPVSPAPPQILRVGAWAILEVPTAVASPERGDSRRDEGIVRPALGSSSIFHPPRLSSSLLTS